MSYDKRLEELQITLPPPPVAGGLYIPALKVGNQLWVSGQIPKQGKRDLAITCSNTSHEQQSPSRCMDDSVLMVSHS